MTETLMHGRNCPANTPGRDCLCGLVYRQQLQTEQTLHAAWRERAEEAEAALATHLAALQAAGMAVVPVEKEDSVLQRATEAPRHCLPATPRHVSLPIETHTAILGALKKAAHELNAIRARDGAPQHIDWDRGRPLQSDSCTHEYWDALTEECFAAIAKAPA